MSHPHETPEAQAALKAAIVCITQFEVLSRKVDGDAATIAGVPIMPHIAVLASLLTTAKAKVCNACEGTGNGAMTPDGPENCYKCGGTGACCDDAPTPKEQ